MQGGSQGRERLPARPIEATVMRHRIQKFPTHSAALLKLDRIADEAVELAEQMKSTVADLRREDEEHLQVGEGDERTD